MREKPAWDIAAGCVLRAPHALPRSGVRRPWNVRQNFRRRHRPPVRPDRRGNDLRPGRRSRPRRLGFANFLLNTTVGGNTPQGMTPALRQPRSSCSAVALRAPPSWLSTPVGGRPLVVIRSPETGRGHQHQPPQHRVSGQGRGVLPESLRATNDPSRRPTAPPTSSSAGALARVPQCPSKSWARSCGPWCRWCPLVKGLEQGTNQRDERDHRGRCCLLAPGRHPGRAQHRQGGGRGYAAAAVLAMPDQSPAADLAAVPHQALCTCTTDDVVGVEMAGALKNVYAIAVGMGYCWASENTRAMVMTRRCGDVQAGRGHGRAPRHVRRPGRDGRSGGHRTSQRSRNRHVGEQLQPESTRSSPR